MATKIDPMQNSLNISSFFQKKITQINTSETIPKTIKADIKKNKNSKKQSILINNSTSPESINNT